MKARADPQFSLGGGGGAAPLHKDYVRARTSQVSKTYDRGQGPEFLMLSRDI